MCFLFEKIAELARFIIELLIEDSKVPKIIRIILLVLLTFIDITGIVFLILGFMTTENIIIKVVLAGLILLFGGMLIELWCDAMKVGKK